VGPSIFVIPADFLNIHHESASNLALLRFKSERVGPETNTSRITGMDTKKTASRRDPLENRENPVDKQSYLHFAGLLCISIIEKARQLAFQTIEYFDVALI